MLIAVVRRLTTKLFLSNVVRRRTRWRHRCPFVRYDHASLGSFGSAASRSAPAERTGLRRLADLRADPVPYRGVSQGRPGARLRQVHAPRRPPGRLWRESLPRLRVPAARRLRSRAVHVVAGAEHRLLRAADRMCAVVVAASRRHRLALLRNRVPLDARAHGCPVGQRDDPPVAGSGHLLACQDTVEDDCDSGRVDSCREAAQLAAGRLAGSDAPVQSRNRSRRRRRGGFGRSLERAGVFQHGGLSGEAQRGRPQLVAGELHRQSPPAGSRGRCRPGTPRDGIRCRGGSRRRRVVRVAR